MSTDAPDSLLREITTRLDANEIPYMVVGSFASTFHGEPRTTQDLDIVIDPTFEQLEHLLASLSPVHYYVDPDVARDALRRRSMFNVIEMDTAWKVDLIVRKQRAFSTEELRRREQVVMLGARVATATAEDTIVAKLEWAKLAGSDRQLVDVAGIVRVRSPNLDLAYVEHWVTELELVDEWVRARALVRYR